jgi:RHS repeat-associated protein
VVTGLLGGDRVSKHYYMNQQRVATDITINYDPNGGSGGEYAPSKGLDDLKKVVQELNHEPLDTSILELPSLTDYYPETATAKSSSSQAEGAGSSGRILFWYHPDYLGNVDLVTEIDGFAHEFFIYNPWGEEMHQWNANTYAFTSPYRFNSKELDPETGLAYYGARYYQNKMGVWLSVDPMATKFHSLTPFHFVANNPINIVDPNGLDTHFVDNQARSDFKAAQAQVNQRVAKLHAAVDRDNQLANQKGVLPGLSRFLRSENRHKRELNDWKKLQNDFDNICNPNTRLVSYQSGNVPEKADGTTDGETSVAILVKVKPGYLSTYIHENRHVNQIMNGTTGIGGSQGNTDWFDEIEAFQYQQIFNFQDVQQKLEASAAKHGQLSFTIEEMVKREYLEPHYIKSTSDIK